MKQPMLSSFGTTLPRAVIVLALTVCTTIGLAGTTGMAAATTITITTTGTIARGRDYGLFGINSYLQGYTYTISQSFDFADKRFFVDGYPSYDLQGADYTSFKAFVTVGDITLTFDGDRTSSVRISNGVNPNYGSSSGGDVVIGRTLGLDRSDPETAIYIEQVVRSYKDDILSSSRINDQSLSYAIPTSDYICTNSPPNPFGWFNVNDTSRHVGAEFCGKPTRLTVNTEDTAIGTRVPEPASLAMLGASLIGLAVARRARGRGRAAVHLLASR